jgi:hypothetical protein
MSPRLGALAAIALLGGCDIDQSFLFPVPIDGVPGVQDIGFVTPVKLTTPDEVRQQVIYGEIGPTGSAELGGVTFQFYGVGGTLCVFVDPETVYWNQSVSPSDPDAEYSQIDNFYDDGDLDLYVGETVYYTGTPGERLGNFQVRYEDSLGNTVPIDLGSCVQKAYNGANGGHAGRSTAEYCTISDTLPGVKYTVMMHAFSTPLDDDRLGYGLLVTEGACSGGSVGQGLIEFMGADADKTTAFSLECVIQGESIEPGHEQGAAAKAYGLTEGTPTWIGDEVPTWEGSIPFEKAFCDREVNKFCKTERKDVDEAGETCAWEQDITKDESLTRCYCGDPADAPSGGAF